MPTVIPFVPENITVHLGPPSANAENVERIKNYLSVNGAKA